MQKANQGGDRLANVHMENGKLNVCSILWRNLSWYERMRHFVITAWNHPRRWSRVHTASGAATQRNARQRAKPRGAGAVRCLACCLACANVRQNVYTKMVGRYNTCDWIAAHAEIALLWSPYVIGQTGRPLHFCPVGSSFFFFFFSSPNLSGHRLDVCHTSSHGVALV